MSDADIVMSPEPTSPIDDALNEHHREIENSCLEIMSAAYANEPRDLVLRWREVERELLQHMAAEELLLLPRYQEVDPANAQEVRDQHGNLRDHAFEIGVAIQLHTIQCDQLQEFVGELRAHAAFEAALYRWAQQHLGTDRRRRLLQVLR
jgi:hypothetical protein